ncbi:MAG: glycerophosphodiester phosphodiesterase [Bacteroidaceae bacterium]|nr:glycerophosphodiester phosphodiesterase [Bacteroidaceae bacterium]
MRKLFILFALASAIFTVGCAPKEKENKVAITAHRGFWNCEESGYPGNTISSLRVAQDNEFWGCEFDVHITGDDQLLLNHDAVLNGKNIHEMPIDTFLAMVLPNGEHPTSADAFLSQAEKNNIMLVWELKPHESEEREYQMIDKTIEALKAHNLYDPERVMFISFSLNICKRIAELCPEFTNQFLEGGERDLGPQEIHEKGINGIDYHFSKFQAHPEWVEQAHNLGMSVNVWTVDDEQIMRDMIDLGIECITTNEPLKVREILGERELKR